MIPIVWSVVAELVRKRDDLESRVKSLEDRLSRADSQNGNG
jgi:hypothetical protein